MKTSRQQQASGSQGLYNPIGLVAASLIFTPLLGALFQAKNWEVLNKPDEARASRAWVRTSLWLIFMFIAAQALFANEPAAAYMTPYFLFVLWGSWALLSGLRQVRYAKETGEFDRRPKAPFGRVFTLGLGGYVIYFMVSLSIGLIFDAVGVTTHSPKSDVAVTISVPEGASEPVVVEAPIEPAKTE